MAQRNILCMHQTLDKEMELGQTHLHPEHMFWEKTIDLTNPSIHLVPSSSGSTADVDLHHLSDHHDTNLFYGNQYGNVHHHHHSIPNLNVGGAAPSAYSPYIIPSSTGRIYPVPLNYGCSDHVPSSCNHGVMGVGVDEHGSNNFLDNVQGSGKRKNTEVVPRSCHYVNGSTSSSSPSVGVPLISGLQQWEKPYESGVVALDTLTFTPSQYRGGGVLSITEGSPRSVRSRANAISLQLDSALAYHRSHPLQGNYIGHSFHPTGNAWVEQLGNNGSGTSCSNWNYASSMAYLHGRSVGGGLLEIGNMSGQGYQDMASGSNSAIILHPSSTHHHYNHHPLPMQGMRGVSYGFHYQSPAPSYRHPTNCNLHQNTVSSHDGPEYASRYPRPFPSSWDRISRPHRSVSGPDELNGRMRLLSSEDVAGLECPPGFYGGGNFIDQHRDMRLDIDDMSYEELLALEERIGDVNTGLSEETIIRSLRTKLHASCTPPPLDQSSGIVQENMNCTICQVDYAENEKIGILECGHGYHADCIKQWLLLKNMCPICKATALSRDDKER